MITINVAKARSITHDRRRAARQHEMEPHDKVIALAVPGADAKAAEASRQSIREKYAVIQTEIDACGTVDELKALIDREAI